MDFDATDADLALFLEEAAEQLETLSGGLLRMEREAGEPQLIQAVFRAAHTLKGSSATIGHHRMASLTHAMESVLDNIRKGALVPHSGVIDALLASVDALQVLNEEVSTRIEAEISIVELIDTLHQVATAPPPVVEAPSVRTLNDEEQATVAAASEQPGMRAFEIEVTVDPASEWPAVRAYQALIELAGLGVVVRSWPTEAELGAGEGGHQLTVVLVSEREPEAFQEVAAGVTDVIAVAVRGWREQRAPGASAVAGAVEPEAAAAEDTPTAAAVARPADGPAESAAPRVTVNSRVVKVDIARLDELMNLVGELVIDRGRLLQVLRELSGRFGNDNSLEHLSEITQHLARVSDDLQEQVMLARLLPVESVFNRFPRMVRDLARRTGKSVRFVMEGEQTGLDRSVIDEIGDPLLHLLRNAVDHGVEPTEDRIAAGKPAEATLLLSARHEESHIVIEVTDDGRGIDPEKIRSAAVHKGVLTAEVAARLSDDEAINLIFAPGFSSAEKVTDVSGRGVGMDIVRTNIEKINGTVQVFTRVGEGTTFAIKLPLTLAIIRALLVKVRDSIYTVPLASVQETLRIRAGAIHTVQQREVVLVRGQALPLVWLSRIFHGQQAAGRDDSPWCYVVAVRTGRTDLGLVVDELIGEQEVVIKSIGALGEVDGVAGATILGDGRVSMIVDVPKVVELLAGEASQAA